jgi:hypothetical protein
MKNLSRTYRPPNPLNTKALLIAHFMYCSQIYPKKYRSKINLYSHICSSIYSILGHVANITKLYWHNLRQ